MLHSEVRQRTRKRRGAVLILFGILLIPIVAMVAFAIDINYVAGVKTELQRSADAAALAGAGSLLDDEALRGAPSDTDESVDARLKTGLFSSLNPAGRVAISTLDADVTVGYIPNPNQPDTFTANGYANAVKVFLRRDSSANGAISLFFAPVLGIRQQQVHAEATAIFEGGIKGFNAPWEDANSSILPYTLHIDDWTAAFASGADNWSYNEQTGEVKAGSDGIREVKLFPSTQSNNGKGKGGVTPGNFGTVDIGAANNSTSDLARQILNGPNAEDFSHLPQGKLEFNSNGTLTLNGDTGISAGVKDELAQIKGEPRTIPLYSEVSGNGNNAQFTIVRFVGMRIVDVNLTGSASSKHITIQPAYVVDATAIRGGTEFVTSAFVRQPLRLIK